MYTQSLRLPVAPIARRVVLSSFPVVASIILLVVWQGTYCRGQWWEKGNEQGDAKEDDINYVAVKFPYNPEDSAPETEARYTSAYTFIPSKDRNGIDPLADPTVRCPELLGLIKKRLGNMPQTSYYRPSAIKPYEEWLKSLNSRLEFGRPSPAVNKYKQQNTHNPNLFPQFTPYDLFVCFPPWFLDTLLSDGVLVNHVLQDIVPADPASRNLMFDFFFIMNYMEPNGALSGLVNSNKIVIAKALGSRPENLNSSLIKYDNLDSREAYQLIGGLLIAEALGIRDVNQQLGYIIACRPKLGLKLLNSSNLQAVKLLQKARINDPNPDLRRLLSLLAQTEKILNKDFTSFYHEEAVMSTLNGFGAMLPLEQREEMQTLNSLLNTGTQWKYATTTAARNLLKFMLLFNTNFTNPEFEPVTRLVESVFGRRWSNVKPDVAELFRKEIPSYKKPKIPNPSIPMTEDALPPMTTFHEFDDNISKDPKPSKTNTVGNKTKDPTATSTTSSKTKDPTATSTTSSKTKNPTATCPTSSKTKNPTATSTTSSKTKKSE